MNDEVAACDDCGVSMQGFGWLRRPLNSNRGEDENGFAHADGKVRCLVCWDAYDDIRGWPSYLYDCEDDEGEADEENLWI